MRQALPASVVGSVIRHVQGLRLEGLISSLGGRRRAQGATAADIARDAARLPPRVRH